MKNYVNVLVVLLWLVVVYSACSDNRERRTSFYRRAGHGQAANR